MAVGQNTPSSIHSAASNTTLIERIWISTSHARTVSPLIGTAPYGGPLGGRCGTRTHDLSRVRPFEPLSVTWGHQQPSSDPDSPDHD